MKDCDMLSIISITMDATRNGTFLISEIHVQKIFCKENIFQQIHVIFFLIERPTEFWNTFIHNVLLV